MKYELNQAVRVAQPNTSEAPREYDGTVGCVVELEYTGSESVNIGVRFQDGNVRHYVPGDLTAISPDSWDDLVPGQTVIVNERGEEVLILAYLPQGKVFLSSMPGSFGLAHRYWFTVAEAIEQGWTVKGAGPEKPKTIGVKGGQYTADELRAKLEELES